MRYGCCTSMLCEPVGTGHALLPDLARAGFDYAELPLAQVMALDKAAFMNGPLAAVRASGLPCLAMNNFLPASLRLTGPSADHPQALDYAKRALERAAQLGAGVVVMGSSGARNRPLGTGLAAATAQLADFLQALSPIAEGFGIRIALEHLNPLESNILNTFEEGLNLARRAASPAIGVLVDYYHLRMVLEPADHLRPGAGRLLHAHLARPLGRGYPQRGDGEDYRGFLALLADISYTGTLSLECAGGAGGLSAAAEALKVLKDAERGLSAP